MSGKQVKTAYPNEAEGNSGLVDLGREMARFGVTEAPAAGSMAAEVELRVADLLADDNGEIVFFNDSGFRRLAIRTAASVVADGRSGPHRTAAGAEVDGFSFVTFDDGLTLYYEDGLDLVVRASPR